MAGVRRRPKGRGRASEGRIKSRIRAARAAYTRSVAASPHLRGFLRLYLGAAAGVGKTYQMLGDARLAAEEGADLVIGYLEPHGRVATEERARGLERAPLVRYGSGGRAESEPDYDWLLERRPSVAIIDELAHTNAAGAAHRKRYDDVALLLENGIDVWTTVNIQHLESLNSRIRALTGVEVQETFPDRWLHEADEIRLVDLSPRSLRERIGRGLVYPADRVDAALRGFFTVENLTALRALVLHELAEVAAAELQTSSPEPARSSASWSRSAPAATPTPISCAPAPASPAAATRSSTSSPSSPRTAA